MKYSNGKEPKNGDAVFHRDASNLLHACRVQRVEKDGKLWLREAGAKKPMDDAVPAETCILQDDHNAEPPAATSPLATLERDPSGAPASDEKTAGEPPLSPEPSTNGKGNQP